MATAGHRVTKESAQGRYDHLQAIAEELNDLVLWRLCLDLQSADARQNYLNAIDTRPDQKASEL